MPPIGLKVRRANAVGNRVFLEGNSAAALGCVYGGATVAAWYPDHALLLSGRGLHPSLPQVPPRSRKPARRATAIIQAEDELAAIGIVIGAAWNGARAFTCTSGPGISLMQEFIGLAYFAEIPAVIFDVQRGGPSTGMPTRTQQSDVLSLRLRLARRHQARAAVSRKIRKNASISPRRRSTWPSACRRRSSCCSTWTSA